MNKLETASATGDRTPPDTLDPPRTARSRSVRLGNTPYPVDLPSRADPRLLLAATLLSLHVLGQTVLGFELSIAQILVAMLTCAVIEIVLTMWMKKRIVWPASALLTGSGVAFILRVNGTEHGDWWSLNGWYIYAATAAFALLTKYVIRVGDRPLFNPSNVGLVVCFLVLGTALVNPLDLWWGPMSPSLAAAIAVIVFGGTFVTRRLGLIGISMAFWLTFATSLAVVSAQGHCMQARWSVTPVCGQSFWWVLVTSPEILIFMIFMITDPKTIPTGRTARIAYGILVGFTTALLVAAQTTEFATKVAILGGLVIVCGFRPLLDRALPSVRSEADRTRSTIIRLGQAGVALGIAFALLSVVGGPARHPITIAAAPAPGTPARPAIDLGPDAVPPVAVDASVDSVAAPTSPETAAAMGRDLVEDLAIESNALRDRDSNLAASAVIGRRLESVRNAIDGTPNNPAVSVRATYRVDHLTATLVRTPGNPQAPPSVGLRAQGTIERGGRNEAFDTLFVLVKAGDHYLISAGVAA